MRRWSPMRSPELRPEIPDVLYTRSGDVAIAYQTFGDGPPNLVLVPTFSNLVFPWLNASWREMYEQFASFVRLIMLDKRGTGLSDRPRELGTLETRMDDIRAVLDAAAAERAVLVGLGEGGQTCALFAATYPERTEALVLVGTPARAVRADDYPFGPSEEEWRTGLRAIRERWGSRGYFEEQAGVINPTADDEFIDWFVTCQRFCASPGAALTSTASTEKRTYGRCSRRSVYPRSCSTALLCENRCSTWRAGSRAPGRSRSTRTSRSGFARFLARSRHSFRRGRSSLSLTRFWPLSSSRTSSGRRTERPSSETGHGGTSCTTITWRSGASWPDSAARSSTPRATASLPSSTGRRAPSPAPAPSSPRSVSLASTCEPACTPVNAKSTKVR